jgi:uncharacterized protein (TIGR02145 family)
LYHLTNTSNLTSLTPNTTYFVRSYATNAIGTGYSIQVTFTTTDFIFKEVISTTGRIWMDRNLGAKQVAASSTDTSAYGDLYQWGRGADGHQLRASSYSALNAQSASDQPGHNKFILGNVTISDDWRNPSNDNLWQGVNGINNACPVGFRLPTSDEWDIERKSWISDNASGAFTSPLKLVIAGLRYPDSDPRYSFQYVGTIGEYWSSTIHQPISGFTPNPIISLGIGIVKNTNNDFNERNYGASVRCIKN